MLSDQIPVGQRKDHLQDFLRQGLIGGQVLRIRAAHQRDRPAQLALSVIRPCNRRVDDRRRTAASLREAQLVQRVVVELAGEKQPDDAGIGRIGGSWRRLAGRRNGIGDERGLGAPG